MYSFWTLFKVHFLAESLSKALLSGKWPKPVLLFLSIFFGLLFVSWWIAKVIFRCLTYPLRTQRAKIRRSFRRICLLAKKQDDTPSAIRKEDGDLILEIEGHSWRNRIRTIAYRVNVRTGIANVLLFGEGIAIDANYHFLRQYCGIPADFELTYEHLPAIHGKIRINLL